MTDRCEFRRVPQEWFVEQVQSHTPFSMARWSDGEWPCVLGAKGCNTDKHPYSWELKTDLTKTLLERPKYIMALQELVYRTIAQDVHNWLVEHKLEFDWVSGEVFHRSSIKGTLQPWIDALADRRVILVGPERLSKLDGRLFPVVHHVRTPLLNCHSEVDRVVSETMAAVSKHGVEPVVSISASMSANVIVHRLHKWCPHGTFIDMGSVWEPYVGVACRSYHAKVVHRLQAEGVL